MRISPAVTLAASIAIGAVALIAARGWLKPSSAEATALPAQVQSEKSETVSVVIAKRPIPRGAAVDPSRLDVQEWPVAEAPEGSFRSVEAIGSNEYASRRALLPIEAGQPILTSALTDAGVRPTLAARLAPGYRAYTLRMTDVTGVGGFVLPGDRIDVLFTWDQTPESRQQNLVTEVLLQNVEVLGLDLNDDLAEETPSIFKTATIAVEVKDAQKLSLAAQTGTLAFVLRGIEDHAIGTFTSEHLTTGSSVAAAQPVHVKSSKPRDPAKPDSVRIDVVAGENALAFNVPRSE